MIEEWPFDQPKNCIAFSTKAVVFEGAPILYVYHDEDDHGWQFIGLESGTDENIALICMEHIVSMDPSVKEVAHIAPGYYAWRETPETAWNIERNEFNDED